MILGFLLSLLLNFSFTIVILPKLMDIIVRAEFVRPNYRGKAIPVGGGLVLFLSSFMVATVSIVGCAISVLSEKQILSVVFGGDTFDMIRTVLHGLMLFFGMAVMTLAGLLDDFFGNRASSGLVGHFRSFFRRGEITTGFIKAVLGGLVAGLIVLADQLFIGTNTLALNLAGSLITKFLIISLSINFVNLLDLRPGRAGKGYILAVLILGALSWPWAQQPEMFFLLFISASLAAYLPYDLQARVMMGDCGANALGLTLGVVSCWVLAENILPFYLGTLVIIHLVTERYSLTKLIANNAILRYLDEVGQK